MIITIIILSIIVVSLGFTTFNLLKKIEKYEDLTISQEEILKSYMDYLSKISQIIEESDKKLKIIDEKGSFASDDEIGWFFDNVKMIQNMLSNFIIKKIE